MHPAGWFEYRAKTKPWAQPREEKEEKEKEVKKEEEEGRKEEEKEMIKVYGSKNVKRA